jgi:hypothetical protein
LPPGPFKVVDERPAVRKIPSENASFATEILFKRALDIPFEHDGRIPSLLDESLQQPVVVGIEDGVSLPFIDILVFRKLRRRNQIDDTPRNKVLSMPRPRNRKPAHERGTPSPSTFRNLSMSVRKPVGRRISPFI